MKTRGRVTGWMAWIAVVAVLAGAMAAHAADGTWTNTTSGGLWSDTGNWSGGTVADGNTSKAYFNTLDLTADNTVHLDSSRTLGQLVFGDTDTGTAAGWTIDNNGNSANVLTLGYLFVNNSALGAGKNVTISANIVEADNHFYKDGAGELVLAGNLSASGKTFWINSGTVTIASGGSDNGVSAVYFNVMSNAVLRLTAANRIPHGANGYLVAYAGGRIEISAADTIAGFGSQVGGIITNLNGFAVTLTPNGTWSTASGTIAGWFSPLSLNGGTQVFAGTNTYTGVTDLSSGGRLFINSATALGTSALRLNGGGFGNNSGSAITLINNNSIQLNASFTFEGPNNLNFGTGSADMNTGAAGTRTATISAGNLTFGGNITGAADRHLTKAGAGTLTLGGANAYAGSTTVNAGALLVNGSLASASAVTVNSGGTLGGTGTVNGTASIVSGGTLAAGDTNRLGTLTLANGLTFASGATNVVRITGWDPGQNNGAVVTGAVTLANATLVLDDSGMSGAIRRTTIIDKRTAGAISGTFNGLAQGATVTGTSGRTCFITYTGGDGNDAQLYNPAGTVISVR